MLRGVLMLASIVAMSAGVASASADSSFDFVSPAGAQPVGELSGHRAGVKVWEFDGDLLLDGRGSGGDVRVLLAGARAETGVQQRQMVVIFGGIGCQDPQGRLEVTHLARNSDGRVTEFDGSVEHHCERSQDKTFTAKIHYVLGDS